MNKRVILYIMISVILSGGLIFISNKEEKAEPQVAYRVYLKGKSLGLIDSKSNLEDYIDKEQNSIKKKYDVDKVYVPDELDIIKEVTYQKKLLSTKEIYEKIKDISPFTIDGYTMSIKGLTKSDTEGKEYKEKDKIIYTLKKDVFTDAVKSTVQSFITKDKYDAYKEDNQEDIKETGTIIENLYIKNKVTIKESKIPVDKTIYTKSEDLSKFLLFGTTDEQQKYTVKDGDTISDVAFNNKMSTEEFLIANTDFKDENALLYPGQEVTLGIMKPQFDLVEEDHTISDVEVNYETETKYDNSKSTSYSTVEQAGVKGKNRVTQKIQKVNGETTNIVTTNTEQLKAPVKEIIVKGGRQDSYVGGKVPGYGGVVATKGEWGWPASCSTLSSPFGYRWGTLHDGSDIAGCGYGSNIFAAQSGTVVESRKKPGGYPGGYGDNGEYIIIDHHNGFYTIYAHLCPGCRTVKEGDNVTKGQAIGGMGRTGAATGVHLHFGMWQGYPYRGGRALNAMSFY